MRVIAGEHHGRRLRAPQGLATRPTSARARESIFSSLAVRMDFSDVRVLDLYAGSGSLGIEALSRGAATAVFVDSARAAAEAIAHNLRAARLAARARIVVADVRRAIDELAQAGESFHLIFVDAPYREDLSDQVVAALATKSLCAPGGWTVVEQSKRAPAPASAPKEFALAALKTLGDHRIALYRCHRPGIAT